MDTGVYGFYVSNHSGRVQDSGIGVAEVLPDIVTEFGKKITIMKCIS